MYIYISIYDRFSRIIFSQSYLILITLATMKSTPFWASVALLRVSAVLAQSTITSAATATTTSAAPSCTASLITSLCNYTEPGPEFAVASSGKAYCWDYCNAHQPCNFVIFAAGNPYTGTGTCWLYPGETFDASAGSSDCSNPYLSVYDKPVCPSTTTTSDACAATATPSAIASVCGYPAPDDCFYTCSASAGASDCLSQCAEADSCSYVVFNPHNPSNTPYASGTCWMYSNGTYDAGAVTTCSGDPEQFVYNNVCPKPSPSSTSLPSTTASSTDSTASVDSAAAVNGDGTTNATLSSTTSSTNLAPTTRSFINPLAIGMAILLWQGLE